MRFADVETQPKRFPRVKIGKCENGLRLGLILHGILPLSEDCLFSTLLNVVVEHDRPSEKKVIEADKIGISLKWGSD
jgi:hypothetical protein